MSWIDVSVPITDGMLHWPDNPPVSVRRVSDQARGDDATVSTLALGAHTGTHVDAPVHFLPGAAGVDALPLSLAIGPARVVAVEDAVAVRREHVAGLGVRPGERILFRTRNSDTGWAQRSFDAAFVHVSSEAADALAEARVGLVGVDYLSVASPDEGVATHVALLGAGVWIVEGLDLAAVAPGDYDLICLPLRVAGADGAPARVLLRPLPAAQ